MAAARDKLAAPQQLYYQADFFQNFLVARAGEAKAAGDNVWLRPVYNPARDNR
jgi:hypothetical protein